MAQLLRAGEQADSGMHNIPLPVRCPWAGSDIEYVHYHDTEWGVPIRDDNRLFEFLVLEGAQAGLSWRTILRRRDAYRRAFAGFDPQRVARFGEREHLALLADPGIIRNRLKIKSAVDNARAFQGARGLRFLLRLYLAIHWRHSSAELLGTDGRRAGRNANFPRDEQRFARPWVLICWPDNLLRSYAGDGHGK